MNILIRTTAVTWLALVAAAPQFAIASEPGDDEGGSNGLNTYFLQSDNGLGGGGGGGISVPSVDDSFSMPDIGSSMQMDTVTSPSPGIGEQLGREFGPAAVGAAAGAITGVTGAGPLTGAAVGAATALSPVGEAAGDAGAAVGAYTDKTGNNALLPGIESGHSPRPGKSILDSMGDAITGAIDSATQGEQIDLGDVSIEQVLEPIVTPESIEDALSGPQMKSLDPSIKGGQLPISPGAFEDPDAPEFRGGGTDGGHYESRISPKLATPAVIDGQPKKSDAD